MELSETPDLSSRRFMADGMPLYSIRSINGLDVRLKEAIYSRLIPLDLFVQYGIDPRTLSDAMGNRLVQFVAPCETSSVEIKVWHEPGARDPLLYLQLADTCNNQISVLLLVVNDPASPRFDVDRDWSGQLTKFGTVGRNLEAEVAAMQAGLAPTQVRRGLRLMRRIMPIFQSFVSCLGRQVFFIEPLSYHNAILFERYGFAYSQGRTKMEWIQREFAPGGELDARLDGSTPFRQPGMQATVRGRSWAIHDGILGGPFSSGIEMYKRIDADAKVNTFPDGAW